MRVEELIQGSESWLRYKQKTIGSSDAAVILGISPWETANGLFQKKTGRSKKEFRSNPAIDRGNRWEPAARARYELISGYNFPPIVKEHKRYPFLIASLDGYSEEQGIIIEIKCVTSDKVLIEAKGNPDQSIPPKVTDYYYAQIQHQLMVTGAKEAHFFVCHIQKIGYTEQIVDEALVIVKPDQEYQNNLLFKEIEFYNFMQQDIAPPLSNRDYLEADDQSTVLLFTRLKDAKLKRNSKAKEVNEMLSEVQAIRAKIEVAMQEGREMEASFADLREEAIEHAETLGHPKIFASGIKMIKNKNGNWQVKLADEVSNDEEAA